MTTYYVSKWRDLVYVEDADSWSMIRPDGETETRAGPMPMDLVEQTVKVDPLEAQRLIEERRTARTRRLAAERRNRGWLSRRSTRAKVLMALCSVLILSGIVSFVVVWSSWNSPVSQAGRAVKQVDVGMTYEEVESVLGGVWKLSSREYVAGDLMEHYWCEWGHDVEIYAWFEDGHLVQILYGNTRL
ncbi:MAG: hypothetical protein JXA87_11595 [Thermoleophilia bacterium]|nr:hypothetical protein [Thermoleophilia bacterium]